MRRLIVCTAFVISAFVVVASAATDDRANCRAENGDDAIVACSGLIVQNPKDDGAYFTRGVVYYNKHEYDRALADFSQAIKLNSLTHAYHYGGRVYSAKGDYNRAIAYYTKAIGVIPSDATIFEDRGIAYDAEGDHDHAIADYNEALKLYNHELNLHPMNVDGYAGRGIAYTRRAPTMPPVPASKTQKAIMIAQSPTSSRRSGSTRNTPLRLKTAAMPMK
jgi:tetratricopeptide (TPR) repeat protein